MVTRIIIVFAIVVGSLVALFGKASMYTDAAYVNQTVAEASDSDSADGEGETEYC